MADAQGAMAFRGFYGDYDLEISVGDSVVPAKVTLTKDGIQNVTVQLQE